MKAKWGVLGCGGIARRRTIPEGIAKASNAELTAVMDTNTDAVHAVAKEFGALACISEAELLASDCDIVYLATPVNLHLAQAKRAAEAGKHVFCEKPLGVTVDEASAMVNVCKANGVKLGTGLMMRFHAQHQAALEIVRGGRLGKPVFARAQLSCWYPPIEGAWRQDPAKGGGGSLADLGSHCLDLLEMFFGQIVRVSCSVACLVHKYKSEDTAVVIAEFENGARGVVDVLFNVPDASSRNRLELYGTQGCILAEGTIGQGELGEMTAYIEESAKGYEAQQERVSGKSEVISPAPVNMYRAEVEAFSQAVLDNAAPPQDGRIGLWNQKVMAACYESARTGRAVEVG
ncbi:MAG: Gfo/Idh/MocA family oxidoreductase [Candidatus Hydrogenedentes bacterium]|nr:Gfo/Idh/MocA family oxidoreductase [Candidatus Hydrogenedentota bacterium]